MNGTLLVLPSANDAALKRLALEKRAEWRVDRLMEALLRVLPTKVNTKRSDEDDSHESR